MSELPPGWVDLSLGEIAGFEMGQAPPGSASNFDGHGSIFVKAGEFGPRRPIVREWTTAPKKFATSEDVLICVVGATAGKLNLGIDCAIGRSVAAIRPSSAVDQLLLYFQLLTRVDELRAGSTGSAQGVISREMLNRLRLVLPPLPEQKRIADKLDALLARVDACRDRLDRVPGILKRFRQSVLAAATTGELTRDWRNEHGMGNTRQSVVFDDDLLECPASWDVESLTELLDPMRPLCYGVVQPGDDSANGPLLVRVQDLNGGRVVLSDLRTVSTAVDRQYQRSRVRADDVLISVVGTIGRVAIVPVGFEGNIARAVARLTCGPRVLPKWMSYWLQSSIVQWWLIRSSREVARKTLNLSELATTRVAVPSISEQTEIVRRTDQLLSYATQIEQRVAASARLLSTIGPSLLERAFRGELIPQDPNDEPASALLARIGTRANSIGNTDKPNGRGKRGPRTKSKALTNMLSPKNLSPHHLTTILKARGPLTAEALWAASQLEIDDFYDQLKDEEGCGFLREKHGDSPMSQRLIEAAA